MYSCTEANQLRFTLISFRLTILLKWPQNFSNETRTAKKVKHNTTLANLYQGLEYLNRLAFLGLFLVQ